MVTTDGGKDPLLIEGLINQAEASKRTWRLPRPHSESSRPGVTDWQELMSERLIKQKRWKGR